MENFVFEIIWKSSPGLRFYPLTNCYVNMKYDFSTQDGFAPPEENANEENYDQENYGDEQDEY